MAIVIRWDYRCKTLPRCKIINPHRILVMHSQSKFCWQSYNVTVLEVDKKKLSIENCPNAVCRRCSCKSLLVLTSWKAVKAGFSINRCLSYKYCICVLLPAPIVIAWHNLDAFTVWKIIAWQSWAFSGWNKSLWMEPLLMRALSLYLLQMRNPHRTSVADEHLVAFSKQHSPARQVCNGYHNSFGELHQTYI